MRAGCRIVQNALFVCGVFAVLSLFCADTAQALEEINLRGIVTDISGRPVTDAVISVYLTPDVRRVADFISAPTGTDGLYHVVAPPRKYWAVARIKTKVDGPLMLGDKHSGEPVMFELESGREAGMDFTVMDLKEAAQIKAKERKKLFRISGRIVDQSGAPVVPSYAIANKTERSAGIPDYLSAWVDDEGRYTLYLPPGKYFMGSAQDFPLDHYYYSSGETTIDADRSGVDVIIQSDTGKE